MRKTKQKKYICMSCKVYCAYTVKSTRLCQKCYSYYYKVKTKELQEMTPDELIAYINESQSLDSDRNPEEIQSGGV